MVAERSPVFGEPPSNYRVQPGDTLYSIAWRFGFDHAALAQANDIPAPYTIYVGQIVRLTEAAPPPRGASRTDRPERSTAREPVSPAAARSGSPPAAAVAGWRRPTDAPVRRAFGNGNRGVDFALESHHRVVAAAAGKIVYAGSGLGGFRHLVIVEHDPEYLSAYSLNRDVVVEEGQEIKAGELLADNEMEESGRRLGALHFEIRRRGDPVDPGPLIGR